MQQRINYLLDPATNGATTCCGIPATARQYFTDLRLIVGLIESTWPRAVEVWPVTAGQGTCITEYLSTLRWRSQHGMPASGAHVRLPAEASACAALLTAAGSILDCDNARVLGDQLQYLLADENGDDQRQSRSELLRYCLPDCSPGLRRALGYVIQDYGPLSPGHGRKPVRTPVRQTRYAPEHVAAFLEDNWYDCYFRHMQGIQAAHLRRAAAVRLCQITSGGSIADAAARLSIPFLAARNAIQRAHHWMAQSAEPRQFERAAYALADALDQSTDLVDYGRRRHFLQTWCLDTATWAGLASQVKPSMQTKQPACLSDRKRQTASILVWTRITHGEHVYAPHPLLDALPGELQAGWKYDTHALVSRLRLGRATLPQLALKRVLDSYADALAARIDNGDS